MKKLLIIIICFSVNYTVLAQQETPLIDTTSKQASETQKRKWFQSFSIGGYLQIRYNGLFDSNPNLGCEQCDKAWNGNGNFSIRRARIIFSGQIHRQIFFYIQPDFASAINGSQNIAQLRDAYFDVGVDKRNEFRFRIGQSKVPFSFENLQSSRNRLSLDRNDGTNSSFTNERDLGIHFMWAPEKRRAMFKSLVDDGLKGSGDYGVISLGIINGQPLNTKELNKNKHVVLRFTYPFQVKNQLFEAGVQAYSGLFQLQTKDISAGVKHKANLNYKDERIGVHAVWYPKPFGIQAEYNIGRGPEFNKFTDSIETQTLAGGYVMLNYQVRMKNHLLIPFMKYKYYEGGKKYELDARSYNVNEVEIGVEWQLWKHFEIVLMYTYSERRYEDYNSQENFQRGSSLRAQIQFNF
ncbi:MAG TPA: porin [Crocinitomicaceae bacterium]|nr:porin [Crocinitomicaceae bacterium]